MRNEDESGGSTRVLGVKKNAFQKVEDDAVREHLQ